MIRPTRRPAGSEINPTEPIGFEAPLSLHPKGEIP
jgi:hypothetical protein